MNFTYRIKWSLLDISYYGVRYSKRATTDSLMTTYFTSSKYVHKFIEENGLPDVVKIRKKFDTMIQAKQWEERVISKGLFKSEKWLNKGNSGSFKGIVMDTEMIDKIVIGRNKNKKEKQKAYNNGIVTKYFGISEEIPLGWQYGRIKTEKILKHIETMKNLVNNYSKDRRLEVGKKISIAGKGKSKPDGFGAKVSNAQKGKPKLGNSGENSSSKRTEVRAKLSISKKGKGLIRWFFNNITKEKIWVHVDNVDTVDLTIFTPGRPPNGEWYNDGIKNIWVRYNESVDIAILNTGKIKIKYYWVTNGTKNFKLREGVEAPEGFKRGKTQSIKKGQIKYYNNGIKNITIKNGEKIPDGFSPGKKHRA